MLLLQRSTAITLALFSSSNTSCTAVLLKSAADEGNERIPFPAEELGKHAKEEEDRAVERIAKAVEEVNRVPLSQLDCIS